MCFAGLPELDEVVRQNPLHMRSIEARRFAPKILFQLPKKFNLLVAQRHVLSACSSLTTLLDSMIARATTGSATSSHLGINW